MLIHNQLLLKLTQNEIRKNHHFTSLIQNPRADYNLQVIANNETEVEAKGERLKSV